MLKLRTTITGLIVWLFLFFNVERITEPLNIASFVYVLVPVSIGIVLLLPRVFKNIALLYWIIFVLIVYIICKAIFASPFFSHNLSVTITEIASIVVSLMLAGQVGHSIWDFENAIESLTFRQIGVPPRLYETTNTEDLYREVKRSRRFQHPLSLLVLRPNFDASKVSMNKMLIEFQQAMAERYVQARIAKLLSDELRDIDLVIMENGEFIVLLPETSRDEALHISERLQQAARVVLNVELLVGSAAFPDQAVTLTGLIDTACAEFDGAVGGPKKTSPLPGDPGKH